MNAVCVNWRMSWLAVVVVSCLTGSASAQSGSSASVGECEWECEVKKYPAYERDNDSCGIGNSGHTWVNLRGWDFDGDGYASDGQFGCDINCFAQEVGLQTEVCRFKPMSSCTSSTSDGSSSSSSSRCKGTVEVMAKAEANGAINLANADCEAAALGSIKIFCPVLSTPCEAVLRHSQGATGSSQIGSFSYAGGTILISTGLGEGVISDHQLNILYGQATTNYFTYTIQAEAVAYCWANGGWGGLDLADARIDELNGEGTVNRVLGVEY